MPYKRAETHTYYHCINCDEKFWFNHHDDGLIPKCPKCSCTLDKYLHAKDYRTVYELVEEHGEQS